MRWRKKLKETRKRLNTIRHFRISCFLNVFLIWPVRIRIFFFSVKHIVFGARERGIFIVFVAFLIMFPFKMYFIAILNVRALKKQRWMGIGSGRAMESEWRMDDDDDTYITTRTEALLIVCVRCWKKKKKTRCGYDYCRVAHVFDLSSIGCRQRRLYFFFMVNWWKSLNDLNGVRHMSHDQHS